MTGEQFRATAGTIIQKFNPDTQEPENDFENKE